MKVVKTKNIGFCFGVKRAINMVLKVAEATKDPVFTIGPIIHNPQMVRILEEKGVVPVKDVYEITNGTVVFRTHGVKKDEEEHIKQKGLRIIDTTCPFVKRVREHAMYLKKKRLCRVLTESDAPLVLKDAIEESLKISRKPQDCLHSKAARNIANIVEVLP